MAHCDPRFKYHSFIHLVASSTGFGTSLVACSEDVLLSSCIDTQGISHCMFFVFGYCFCLVYRSVFCFYPSVQVHRDRTRGELHKT